MKKTISTILATAILIAGMAAGTSAGASVDGRVDARLDDEVAACASAFRERIDLDGVYRIRHVVTSAKPAVLGRAFTLETSAWTDSDERRYRATCIVNGDHPPFKLRIRELTD